MAKQYEHVKELEQAIITLKAQGVRNREISEIYGIKVRQLENLINRHNRREKQIEKGNIPKRRGRPRTEPATPIDELKAENNRLQMENDLLRDFLYAVGKR